MAPVTQLKGLLFSLSPALIVLSALGDDLGQILCIPASSLSTRWVFSDANEGNVHETKHRPMARSVHIWGTLV